MIYSISITTMLAVLSQDAAGMWRLSSSVYCQNMAAQAHTQKWPPSCSTGQTDKLLDWLVWSGSRCLMSGEERELGRAGIRAQEGLLQGTGRLDFYPDKGGHQQGPPCCCCATPDTLASCTVLRWGELPSSVLKTYQDPLCAIIIYSSLLSTHHSPTGKWGPIYCHLWLFSQ